MDKKIIFGIAILAIMALASYTFLNGETPISEPQISEPPIVPPPTTEPTPVPPTTAQNYYDDKLGYAFDYPAGWELYVSEDSFPDKDIKKVISLQKRIPRNDSVVFVEIELKIRTAKDMQDIKDSFRQDMNMSGLSILDESAIKVNDKDGYDMLSGTPDWKTRQVVFFNNETAYIFRYSSQEEYYRMYEESFNNIINSFDIK